MDNLLKLPRDRKIILATHSGSFHADEVFSTVVLAEVLIKNGYKYEIVRTRDLDVIKKADIVYDVGNIYEPDNLRFDHHQVPGPGERNGIPYSSFGLIWKHFGMELCNQNEYVWNEIEKRVASPVDAVDNGIETYKVVRDGIRPIMFQDIASIFNQTWKESVDINIQDRLFMDFVYLAKMFLNRALIVAYENYEGVLLVEEEYRKADDKKIIILGTALPWEEYLSAKNDTLIVIYPSNKDNGGIVWHIKSVRKNVDSFERRCPILPEFMGLSGSELEEASGIKEATFCHKTGYICVTNTKDAAMEVARKTIDSVISNKS